MAYGSKLRKILKKGLTTTNVILQQLLQEEMALQASIPTITNPDDPSRLHHIYQIIDRIKEVEDAQANPPQRPVSAAARLKDLFGDDTEDEG